MDACENKNYHPSGIIWDTTNNIIHFDLNKNSISSNHRMIVSRKTNGKIEMRVEQHSTVLLKAL